MYNFWDLGMPERFRLIMILRQNLFFKLKTSWQLEKADNIIRLRQLKRHGMVVDKFKAYTFGEFCDTHKYTQKKNIFSSNKKKLTKLAESKILI